MCDSTHGRRSVNNSSFRAVAFGGFAQPKRMPAAAFVNRHCKRPGIGIVHHRQHPASEIAHHIGQFGMTGRFARPRTSIGIAGQNSVVV